MPRWRFWRREEAKEPEAAGSTDPALGYVREAERRRLARLLQRRAALLHDLSRAEEAGQPENRWTERIGELEAALAALEEELAALDAMPTASPSGPLPALPIAVTVEPRAEPACVSLTVGEATFRWVEEIDWAERGHQVAPPRLRLVDGAVTTWLAALGIADANSPLPDVVSASLELVAADALAAARREGGAWVPLTLADLARPCERCGGWCDVRGRCPTCAARAWQREQLLLERNRLRQERDEVFRDWQRTRDRLPVIQRQLTEVEADIRSLEAKGVQPADEP
ncbi:MAG: hypothetical protein NZL87_01445 [Thermomicrobium sp.]|nr:hypothetical protein [Thermomicrobium sp.]